MGTIVVATLATSFAPKAGGSAAFATTVEYTGVPPIEDSSFLSTMLVIPDAGMQCSITNSLKAGATVKICLGPGDKVSVTTKTKDGAVEEAAAEW